MPADLPLNFCSDEEGAPLGVSSVAMAGASTAYCRQMTPAWSLESVMRGSGEVGEVDGCPS